MPSKAYLAIDLGASSGRHVVGHFDGEKLYLEEVFRFDNGPVDMNGRLYWNLPGLWRNVCQGISAAAAPRSKTGASAEIISVGVDTWGVDFALLGRNDELLGNPYHYRDSRTNGMLERAFEIVPRAEIFRHTGLQFMPINTLYQLLAMKLGRSPLLDAAESILLMPDLIHWLMTGVKCNEMTIASTSQFYNPASGDWARELLEKFGLPTNMFGRIVQPGTKLGSLRSSVAAETGLSSHVVLPGTHDTASAVMAVPAHSKPGARPDWCYISLGTWALMGIESPGPVINDQVLSLNFTNEGGVGNTIRLLKNITGLWLIQECRRAWNQSGKNWSWSDLNRLAAAAPARAAFIDPDAPDFMAPASMPEAIRAYCGRTGQTVPADEGAILRCALDSLAMKFRQVLGMCESLSGGLLATIHIVGGGTQNKLLCQLAADATGRVVIAGPVEATAAGNIMVQAMTDGAVGSIAEAREVVRRSFEVESYEPRETGAWDEAFGRYVKLV
jgi:rhamnulokinase